MKQLLALVERLAPRDITVLVVGETGTGKELVATLLHNLSRRAERPLLRVNCGAIPRDLVEAELFGHTKGAFTGARCARPGFFGAADGGTLVLDEVEALLPETQVKVLRAVELGELQTVGTEAVRRVDVRVIACTNVDLESQVSCGRFRADLYHRLAVVTVRLPPLRHRSEDIPPLIHHFASMYARRFDVGPIVVSAAVVRAMKSLPWRGNVRELENAVAAMVALSEGGTLGLETLALSVGTTRVAAPTGTGLRAQVDAFERALLREALAECGNNQSEMARRLSINRTTLFDVLRRHGLHGPSSAASDRSPGNGKRTARS